MSDFRYWPDDFPIIKPSTAFDIALVAFFDQMVAAQVTVYVDDSWSLFGLAKGDRRIEFIRRGGLKQGIHQYWEVWPFDGDHSHRLGPIFGIHECACVVVDDISSIRSIVKGWLGGAALESLVDDVECWDRTNTAQPLKRQN